MTCCCNIYDIFQILSQRSFERDFSSDTYIVIQAEHIHGAWILFLGLVAGVAAREGASLLSGSLVT